MVRLKKFKLLFWVLIVWGLAVTSVLPSASQAGDDSWSPPQTIAEWPYFQSSSIAIDPNNNWHVVYDEWSDSDGIETTYIKHISSTTGLEIITQATFNYNTQVGETVHYPSVAVDSNGGLHVIYQHNIIPPYKVSLMYTTKQLAVPVLLVHGWRGSPEKWTELKKKLDDEGIVNHIFDYSPGLGDPRDYAVKLKDWIEKLRADTGYAGKFDIVCHSMGAMVSRWYMKELGGTENIRQWIGIAPVNNGAAIADMEFLVPDVLGWFFPGLIGTEEAVKQMKIKSPTLAMLNYDIDEFNLDIWGTPQHLSSGIIYRNIMGINSAGVHSFSSITAGKTLVVKKDSKEELYSYWTRQGDGVVAMEQSMLKGANVGNEVFEGVNHNTILHNDPEVITKVVEYLKEPSLPLVNNCPTEDPDDDHEVTGTGNQGILPQGEYKPIEVSVDSSVKKATVVTTWPGSELNLTLISPTGKVMEAGVYPVIEYWKGENSIWYVIDLPEPGVWTAGIDAIDVPEEGEPYTFMTFYSSQLTLELTTAEGRYSYNIGDDATILARLSEEDVPITGASVRAEVRRPDELIDEFVLYDDGSHGDALSNDGNYTNVYSLLMPGNYDFTVFASGTFERIEFMTLWVVPIWGDVSQNGKVSAYDASLVLQHVVGLITLLPEQQQVADVTGNGTITALDAALILQYTVGLITEFPAQGAPILIAKDDNPLAPFIKGDENQMLAKIIAELENSSLSTEQKRVLEELKCLIWQRTLLQNYPNPFNPETWIPFQLAQNAPVTISIYNIKGQLIRTLHLGNQQAGIYVVKDKAAYWDGRNHIGEKVASGIYFYTLQAEGFKATRRMVILK